MHVVKYVNVTFIQDCTFARRVGVVGWRSIVRHTQPAMSTFSASAFFIHSWFCKTHSLAIIYCFLKEIIFIIMSKPDFRYSFYKLEIYRENFFLVIFLQSTSSNLLFLQDFSLNTDRRNRWTSRWKFQAVI